MTAIVGNTIFPFGPGIYAANLTDDDVNVILEHAKNEQRDDASMGLVGNIQKEVWCTNDFIQDVITPMLSPHVQQYMNELSMAGRIGPSTPIAYNAARIEQGAEGYDAKLNTDLRVINAWVNFTESGPDFNPPHIHNCDLSSVLYLDVPDKMDTIHPESQTHWRNNGLTTFQYGISAPFSVNEFVVPKPVKGFLIIFPANLTHWVMPYYNAEGQKRVTMSANFQLDQTATAAPWQRKYEWESPLPK